jgi:hypothetical protein
MRFKTRAPFLVLSALALMLAARSAQADDAAPASPQSAGDREDHNDSHLGLGTFGLSGDAGYYTYGMDDVNNRLKSGGNNSINGGAGYGVSAKLGLTDDLAAKVGVDYLFASAPSSRTINGVRYNTQVNLPATLFLVGGEFVVLPLRVANLKVFGGYTIVTIYNGDEKGTDGNQLDMGAITGSGSGFQVGSGLEIFLARGFSVEGDVAYNYARINGATFAGSPNDPNSTSSNGTVDYSGLVGKLAFTVYLVP